VSDPDDTIRLSPIDADQDAGEPVGTSGAGRRRAAPEPEPKPPTQPAPELAPEPAPSEADPEVDPKARKGVPHRRSAHSARGRARRRESRPELPRANGRVVAAAVIVLVAVGALFVPHVRLVLRQSFTQMPQTYTSLAFTADPTIQGTVLSVPVTVQGTNTGLNTYQVKVWTVNGAGKVDESTTAKVPTVKGVTAAVVTLPIATDAAVVWVALNGTDHTIYYKIS
jgi:hypothetical protein